MEHPPPREEISLPLRGRPLRDRYILRLIAIDRVIHFLVLSALAAAIFLFASNKAVLDADFTKILNDLQGGLGGPASNSPHGSSHLWQPTPANRLRPDPAPQEYLTGVSDRSI